MVMTISAPLRIISSAPPRILRRQFSINPCSSRAVSTFQAVVWSPREIVPSKVMHRRHNFGTISHRRWMHASAALGGPGGESLDDGKANSAPARRLVLYGKKGCCLCDGLKEKLEAVFSIVGEGSLADVQLEVRDISTNREWEEAYKYEIPVLACIDDNNSERVLPRLSPRLSPELIQKKLLAAFK